jgi:endonuclease III
MDKVLETIELLNKNYPNAKYYLNFSNTLELMVAAIMSAQVRDEVVNSTTPNIFSKYKTAKDYASADQNDLANDMRSVTFSSMKAKNIINSCKILVEKHKGNVPDNMEDLTSLPGIGRKTANTILINAFGKADGIPTDTHVIRISYRLGWTKSKKPEEIEKDMMKIIPKDNWKNISYLLKAHGRAICKAPVPYCSKCFLGSLCLKNGVTKKM